MLVFSPFTSFNKSKKNKKISVLQENVKYCTQKFIFLHIFMHFLNNFFVPLLQKVQNFADKRMFCK